MSDNCKKLREVLLASLLIGAVAPHGVGAQASKGLDSSIVAKAKAGDATAQIAVAEAYEFGRGVQDNPKKAAEWYLKAAEQGNADAEEMLGLAYFLNNGVPQDYAKAAEWWRKAAVQGKSTAAYMLAVEYQKGGQGINQDLAEAATWYRKAAELGDYHAEYSLALLYDIGNGVPQDQTQAVALYRDAAAKGDAGAQFMLGMNYANGRVVAQDFTEAYFWMDLAASGKMEYIKQEDVAKNRDKAATHLSSAVLAQTQERARKWAEDHPAKTSQQP
jgi:TPR repeat protein